MDRNVVDLCSEHQSGSLDRREFFRKLCLLVGTTAAASVLLPGMEAHMANADLVPKDDPRLDHDYVKFPGVSGEMRAYLASRKDTTKSPAVMVVHENRGLNAHIEDVARRLAVEGFLALAVDALSPSGGTPPDEDQAIKMIGQLDPQTNTANFVAAVQYLKSHSRSTGKVGVVGFCWGGAVANQLAVHAPDLTAAVPYYGRQPADADVPKIKASLLLQYAGEDEGINKGIPAYEAALKRAGVAYRIYVYEGAKHAFNNDTRPDRYNKEAAELAWGRTVSFLKEKLRS